MKKINFIFFLFFFVIFFSSFSLANVYFFENFESLNFSVMPLIKGINRYSTDNKNYIAWVPTYNNSITLYNIPEEGLKIYNWVNRTQAYTFINYTFPLGENITINDKISLSFDIETYFEVFPTYNNYTSNTLSLVLRYKNINSPIIRTCIIGLQDFRTIDTCLLDDISQDNFILNKQGGFQHFELNYTKFLTACASTCYALNNSEIYNFELNGEQYDRIIVENTGTLPYYVTIDNLFFSEVYDNIEEINNTFLDLPNFNITFENGFCLNNLSESKNLFFNISVENEDIDNIYYSLDGSIKTVTKEYNFNKPLCFLGFCYNVPNYDYLQNIIYPYDNSCKFTNSYNSSKYNLILVNGIYQLNTLTDCNGDKNIFFENKNPSEKFSLRFINLTYHSPDLIDENKYLNITLYNSNFEKVISIKLDVNRTYNKLNISFINETGIFYLNSLNEYLEYFDSYNINSLTIENIENETSNNYYLSLSYRGDYGKVKIPFYNDNLKGSEIKYFSLSSDVDTYFRIVKIQNIYSDFKPNFVNIKPNNITISNIGTNQIDFYITNSYYLESDYNKKTYYINVPLCSLNIFSNETFITGENFNENDFCIKLFNKPSTDFLCMFRIPAIIGYKLNTLSFFNTIFTIALFFGMFYYFGKFSQNPENTLSSEELIKKLLFNTFLVVFIFYIVFMLGDKNIFVSFSILGLLFLGNTLNKLAGFEFENSTEKILYSTLFFNFLAYVYFSILQTPTYNNFGILSFPELNYAFTLSSLFSNLLLLFEFLWNILFFTIPSISGFINFILLFVRLISLLAFTSLIIEKIGSIINAIGGFIGKFLGGFI